MSKIKLEESAEHFGFASAEFIKNIDERYMKRVVHRLTGENDGEIFKSPLVKRNDEETYDSDRLNLMTHYMMGALDWNLDELACSPLLGLYDHKGILTSFWDSEPPDMGHIEALQKAWEAWYESGHYVVVYGGMQDFESVTLEVKYETAD